MDGFGDTQLVMECMLQALNSYHLNNFQNISSASALNNSELLHKVVDITSTEHPYFDVSSTAR